LADSKEFMPKHLLILLTLAIMFASLAANDMAQNRRKQPVDLLVLGGTIVTMDGTRRLLDDGGIAVSGAGSWQLDHARKSRVVIRRARY
jgi:hypothetical protein